MFKAISWSEFLTAITLLLGVYYAAIAILYYRNEITDFLKGRSKPKQIKSTDDESSEDVMGSARFIDQHVPREERIATEDIETISRNDHDFDAPETDALLVGTVADLLQEIKSQTDTIHGWKKDELKPFYQEILSKYPQLIGTQYQEAINLFIQNTCEEYCQVMFELHELQQLWPVNS
jgi:hypothetical protein